MLKHVQILKYIFQTEELCYQFETFVLPELMKKLERCNEKHWKHLEIDIKSKIERCKTARNKEKKMTGNYGETLMFYRF